jgi:hypothetical protein
MFVKTRPHQKLSVEVNLEIWNSYGGKYVD